jgi:alkaline phosphatase D
MDDARQDTTRRRFLLLSGGVLAAAFTPHWRSDLPGDRTPRLSDDPFQLGVASGDPLPDGVVLWTRLAPRPLE